MYSAVLNRLRDSICELSIDFFPSLVEIYFLLCWEISFITSNSTRFSPPPRLLRFCRHTKYDFGKMPSLTLRHLSLDCPCYCEAKVSAPLLKKEFSPSQHAPRKRPPRGVPFHRPDFFVLTSAAVFQGSSSTISVCPHQCSNSQHLCFPDCGVFRIRVCTIC